MKKLPLIFLILVLGLLPACQSAQVPNTGASQGIRVLATASFLADIAQNITGDRLQVDSLIPAGLDPHAFEPLPTDIARVADSQVLITNGAGLEGWLDELLANAGSGQTAGGQRLVIEASSGLQSRPTQHEEEVEGDEHGHEEGDPHFWLDPLNVVKYVENIRDGLISADPGGKDTYERNAAAYIQQLQELDSWIRQQVEGVPSDQRLLVTNHESFGYFADRYGFEIVGTILPSASSLAAPSAQQMAALIDHIQDRHVRVIFLETGANPKLADQIAQETGLKVVTGLNSHSVASVSGSTYIDMMKSNTQMMVDALR